MKPDLKVVPSPARHPTMLPRAPEVDAVERAIAAKLGCIATEAAGLSIAVEITHPDVAVELASIVERLNRARARLEVPNAG